MSRRASFTLTAACAAALAASCSDDVGLPDAPPVIDAAVPGTLRVAWTITHDGAPLTCADVTGSSVAVEIVKQGLTFGTIESFSCTSAMGTSNPLPPGAYDLRVSLSGSGGRIAGPVLRLDVTVTSSQTTDVEPVAFDVDPTGTLAFRITTGADNCAAMPGGAGITATRIELRDAAGTCVPTTFAVGAGATSGRPAGTYASDCGAATYGCIADDQELTAPGVAAGQHTMAITGLVGTAACWRRTSSFIVRAAGQTTTLNPQALIRDTVACP